MSLLMSCTKTTRVGCVGPIEVLTMWEYLANHYLWVVQGQKQLE